MPSAGGVDSRVQYVLSTISVLSQCPQENLSHLGDDPSMLQFLDNASCHLLKAVVVKNETGEVVEVTLSNEQLQQGAADGALRLYEVHFVKQQAEAISEVNVASNIQVMSVVQSPIQSLYQSLHNVYAPQILKTDAWSKKMEAKVKDLVHDLDKKTGRIGHERGIGGRDRLFCRYHEADRRD